MWAQVVAAKYVVWLVVALLLGGGLWFTGYRTGLKENATTLADLRAQVLANDMASRKEAKVAQETIDAIQREYDNLLNNPVVRTEYETITRYVPRKPLPAGACADSEFSRLLAAGQEAGVRAPSYYRDKGTAAGASAPVAPAASGPETGYVSAEAFREWAGKTKQQHELNRAQHRALAADVRALPCVKVVP